MSNMQLKTPPGRIHNTTYYLGVFEAVYAAWSAPRRVKSGCPASRPQQSARILPVAAGGVTNQPPAIDLYL